VKTEEYDAFIADLAAPPYFVSMEDGRSTLVCDRLSGRSGDAAVVVLESGAMKMISLKAVRSISYGTPTSPV